MIVNLKALIVVLALAFLVFRSAKPIALGFCTEEDFCRRRNTWFLLTITAFLSPSFWIYVLVAVPVLLRAGRRDSNAVALYFLLLHVIPPIPIDIPAVGVKELFTLDNYRLLSFCVLIPAAIRIRTKGNERRPGGQRLAEYALIAYGILQVAIYVAPDLPNHAILSDSATNMVRRAFLFFVDIYLLFYVISRGCTERHRITDAMAMFCLAGTIMATIAIFESIRHWLLYAGLKDEWTEGLFSYTQPDAFFMRGGMLRAQVSTGHALSLGFLLALALGFWMYIRTHIASGRTRTITTAILIAGLLATQARGPWIGALLIFLSFLFLGPRTLTRITKALFAGVLAIGLLSLTPTGERLINELPIIGRPAESGASDSISYRERLAERSWELIQTHPIMGDPYAILKMEDLRQGEGIIDIVNAYAGVALFYGAIGFTLFITVLLYPLLCGLLALRRWMTIEADFGVLGASLLACTLGTLLMIGTTSLINAYQVMYYALAGLVVAYVGCGRRMWLTERR
jgi:hypothetical protein